MNYIFILYYIIFLYYIILCYVILYYIILYFIILYYILLYYIILYLFCDTRIETHVPSFVASGLAKESFLYPNINCPSVGSHTGPGNFR